MLTEHVIILLGASGAGKSYYADKWIEEHPEYVIAPADQDCYTTIGGVITNKYVIMDYYFNTDFNAERLKSVVQCQVDIIVLFKRPEILSKRRIETKALSRFNPVDCGYGRDFYLYELSSYVDINACRYLDDKYNEYDRAGFRKEFNSYLTPYTYEQVKNYLDYIESIPSQEYDKYYHHFNLPYMQRIGKDGYARNEETWEIIKDWVDWRGKRVLDLCCFHGYFTQQVYFAGAVAHGCDMHNHALYSAAIFARMNNAEITLYHCDIDDGFPVGRHIESPFDVVFLFNVFHHLKDKDAALKRLTKYATVLFEINESDMDAISDYFTITRAVQSPKDGRVILMCAPRVTKEDIQ